MKIPHRKNYDVKVLRSEMTLGKLIFDLSGGSKIFLLVKTKFASPGLDKKTLTPYHLTSLIGGTHMPE